MVKKKSKYRGLKIFLIIIASLVALRFILPFIIFKYTNSVMAEMKGYKGSIEGFDFDIPRLGLLVKGFKIVRTTDSLPVPFVYAERMDNYLEWSALSKGSFVGVMQINNIKVNVIKGGTENSSQTGMEGDITTALKKLKAYTNDKIEIINGTVSYYELNKTPKIDLYLKNMNLTITNLDQVIDKDKKLPSNLTLSGTTIGNGNLWVTGQINALKQVPDFNLNVSMKHMDIKPMEPMVTEYSGFHFKKGQLSLFMEAAMADSYIKGYVKPVLEKFEAIDKKERKEKKEGFFQKIKEDLVGASVDIAKNRKTDKLIMDVPFEGKLKNITVEIIPAIKSAFKNKAKEQLHPSLKNSITIKSAENEERIEKQKKKK